uniref:Uncharacterized protein n=1 Tax=Anopheles atroparvus TaxID=41427 RepID=A0AAG5DUU6_ANOAO
MLEQNDKKKTVCYIVTNARNDLMFSFSPACLCCYFIREEKTMV